MINIENYCVNPKKFTLDDYNSKDKTERSASKEQDDLELIKLTSEINKQQDILNATGKQKLLLILQGMDASGKDGTVRHVFSQCNPLGIKLASFKTPTIDEYAHDYLWRIHQQVPKNGELMIFNRSHYEDVLIVRVHNWINEAECNRRYAQINDFERLLTETGTTIIKCFLNISKEEQKKRMQVRLADPNKTWKFNPNDLKERAYWTEYMVAYENAIKATSTVHAPWYIIPSDSKTNRNLLISRILLHTFNKLELKHPVPPIEYKNIIIND